MTSDKTNLSRVMLDGNWRKATYAAIRSCVPEVRAKNALQALALSGCLQHERLAGALFRRAKGGGKCS